MRTDRHIGHSFRRGILYCIIFVERIAVGQQRHKRNSAAGIAVRNCTKFSAADSDGSAIVQKVYAIKLASLNLQRSGVIKPIPCMTCAAGDGDVRIFLYI